MSLIADAPWQSEASWTYYGGAVRRIRHELNDGTGESAEFMIVASASNNPQCIIHVQDDEPCTLGSGSLASTKCNVTSTVNINRYNLPECKDEREDRHNAVKKSDNSSKASLQKDLMVSDDYFTYRDKFISMLEQFKNL